MNMKCWICGKNATVVHKERTRLGDYLPTKTPEKWRCYCDSCYAEETAKQKKIKADYVRLKKIVMFENAIETLEGQNINIYDYKEAIDAVYDYLMQNLDKFDSSYEILAAIVLIHNRVHCKPQVPVGRYHVDFLLPEEYVVLEIDGERHKGRKLYDSERDKAIKATLGKYWEIVRVDTDLLKNNAPELVTAIRKIYEYRVFGNHDDIYRAKK